jgi:hypothetical protein
MGHPHGAVSIGGCQPPRGPRNLGKEDAQNAVLLGGRGDPINATGRWLKYTFNLSAAESGATNVAPFDPSQIMSIGIKLDTGTPTTTPLPAPPTPATFHVDSIGYQ